MPVHALHPDKLRAIQGVMDKKRQKKPKPAQPGLMQNLAAQAYAARQAAQQRRVF